jgi:putative DNA primase/helicase
MNAETIAAALGGSSRSSSGWLNARCPAHQDRTASLGLRDAYDGGIVYKCKAGCTAAAVGDALKAKGLMPERPNGKAKGNTLGKVIATYCYRSAEGALVFQVNRYEPKDFRQRRPDPDRPGNYLWNLTGVVRPLYRLPELLAADINTPVLLVEGEKDVDRLRSLGLTATTTAQGAEGWGKSDHAALTGRRVVLVPDNDDAGRKYASVAARDLLGKAAFLALLELPDLPPKGDVSDWLDAGGKVETLMDLIERAEPYQPPPAEGEAKDEWAEPEELTDAAEPEPFPLDALPPSIADAVEEYHAYGQQPLEMIGTAALAAASGCVQGLVDLRRDSQLVGPVSINTVVVADSGERKTACDSAFSVAAARWERAERMCLEPLRREASEKRAAYQARKEGILSALRSAAAKGRKATGEKAKDGAAADVDALQKQLRDLGRAMPPMPPMPMPRVENCTAEGVAKNLAFDWPLIAWASNEGGTVTGGHGFKDDALIRTLSFLNQRWDGATMDRSRSTEDYLRVDGRRLTVSLMVQPAAFVAFTTAGSGMARGIGNLARMLVVWPRSTMGTRLRDPDASETALPALERFLARAEELYRTPLSIPFDMTTMEPGTNNNGVVLADQIELQPAELPLSRDARRLWVAYHNECEEQLLPEGEFADVRDVAAKSAENACRLAAIFHVWDQGPHGVVGRVDMERGVTIARWFLYETRRVLGMVPDHAVAADAELLARWALSCAEPPTLKDTLRLAPARLRKKSKRDAALDLLIDRHWARKEDRDGKTVIVLNPALGQGAQ